MRMRCGGKATCWSISALAIHGLLVCGAAAEPDPPTTHLRDYYRYCIVGAGPGGLQLGQYMAHASMDYVILEKARTPGSFYESNPRHRKLISINKRFTGRADAMFNMRHDWNSLLETDVLEMTNRTEERFPHADVLVDYLRDFAAEQEDGGHIAYGTAVTQITRDGQHRFKLHVKVAHSGEKSTLQCGCTIIAQGLHSPNVPAGWDEIAPDGRPLVQGYEDLPPDGRQYENRAVAVFGMGNAGFETADAIAPYSQFVHVYPGSVRKALPIVAWETRCKQFASVISVSCSTHSLGTCSLQLLLVDICAQTWATCGQSTRKRWTPIFSRALTAVLRITVPTAVLPRSVLAAQAVASAASSLQTRQSSQMAARYGSSSYPLSTSRKKMMSPSCRPSASRCMSSLQSLRARAGWTIQTCHCVLVPRTSGFCARKSKPARFLPLRSIIRSASWST